MHQFAIWTMLEDAGLGASLQHYNPLIDEKVQNEWKLNPNWKLIAQMPVRDTGYIPVNGTAENGLKTILFEKNAIGGFCPNEGCIPTKTLLYSPKILDSIKSAAKYGIQADNAPGLRPKQNYRT